MNRLLFLFFFFWAQLIENMAPQLFVIASLGNGIEIRPTLVLKCVALLINILVLTFYQRQHKIPISFLLLSGFLLFSTASVWFVHPAFIFQALTINLHVQLMLNLALFIFLQSNNLNEIKALMQGLRLFATINAMFVIFSFFFNQYEFLFETSASPTGARRAFGIMGDEVSLFLTYFLYDSLVTKRYFTLVLYFTAIICTAGIGAFIVTIALFVYYGFNHMQLSWNTIYLGFVVVLLTTSLLFFYQHTFSNLGVVGRIQATWKGDNRESSNFRVISLSTAASMIEKRPLWGTGFGAYASTVKAYFAPLFKMEGIEHRFAGTMVIVASAFNPYVQMLCETGVVGLVVFILFLFSLFRIFSKMKNSGDPGWQNQSKVASGWFVVFCFTSLSANWFLPASFIMLLVMALAGIHLKLNVLLADEVVPQSH
jgi:O-antigen ligase